MAANKKQRRACDLCSKVFVGVNASAALGSHKFWTHHIRGAGRDAGKRWSLEEQLRKNEEELKAQRRMALKPTPPGRPFVRRALEASVPEAPQALRVTHTQLSCPQCGFPLLMLDQAG